MSCTVEGNKKHMLDCSVAKQAQVALSSDDANCYDIVRAADINKYRLRQFSSQRYVQSHRLTKDHT